MISMSSQAPSGPEFVSIEEAAAALQVRPNTVRVLVRQGHLVGLNGEEEQVSRASLEAELAWRCNATWKDRATRGLAHLMQRIDL
jgi:hypothetical protein